MLLIYSEIGAYCLKSLSDTSKMLTFVERMVDYLYQQTEVAVAILQFIKAPKCVVWLMGDPFVEKVKVAILSFSNLSMIEDPCS